MTLNVNVLYKGQVPKEISYPDAIEDFVIIAQDTFRAAVCDGASESYDSQNWAKLICKCFAENPELSERWMPELILEYSGQYDLEQLPWSKQAAFDRGSFSTLLGLEFYLAEGCVDILAVGDSVAVLMGENGYTDSFPYRTSAEFSQRPQLLSTNPLHNSFMSAPDFFLTHHLTWNLRSKRATRLICMTDALAEWAFRNQEAGNPVWDDLLSINNDEQLTQLVADCRLQKEMRIDDVTLLTFMVTQD
jgi:hypothetical protein